MQVVVVSNHRAPVVTHMVWYRAGAMDRGAGPHRRRASAGASDVQGHRGEPRRRVLQIVARNGGRENAFTSQDFTGYFQSVAADRLELMMELEADRMVNLVLSQEDIDTEREVVREERRSRIGNEPGSRLNEQATAAFFMNHPYGNPVIGWDHEIQALTREDLMDLLPVMVCAQQCDPGGRRRCHGRPGPPAGREILRRHTGARPAARIEWREPPAGRRTAHNARRPAGSPAQLVAAVPRARLCLWRQRACLPAGGAGRYPWRRHHQPHLSQPRGRAEDRRRRRRLVQPDLARADQLRILRLRRCPAANWSPSRRRSRPRSRICCATA